MSAKGKEQKARLEAAMNLGDQMMQEADFATANRLFDQFMAVARSEDAKRNVDVWVAFALALTSALSGAPEKDRKVYLGAVVYIIQTALQSDPVRLWDTPPEGHA